MEGKFPAEISENLGTPREVLFFSRKFWKMLSHLSLEISGNSNQSFSIE